jgi:hypothetical protein
LSRAPGASATSSMRGLPNYEDMATLTDEHLRALHFLARRPRYGYKEATLLEQGFTTGQLGWLVYAGLAKLRLGAGGSKVLRVMITAAGRNAIAE